MNQQVGDPIQTDKDNQDIWDEHPSTEGSSLICSSLSDNKVQVVSAIEDCMTIKFQEPEDSSIPILVIYNQIYRSNIKPGMTDQVFHSVNTKNRFSTSRSWTRLVHRTSVRTEDSINGLLIKSIKLFPKAALKIQIQIILYTLLTWRHLKLLLVLSNVN